MARAVSNGFLDGTLDRYATSTRITALPSEPASISDITNNALASETIDAGDFTKAAGSVSGRRVTVAQQADVEIDVSGTATHVAIDDGTDFFVTVCDSQVLTEGGTITFPAWDIEIRAPAAP